MKFRNIRYGTILEMPDDFSGKNWEPVDPVPSPKAAPKKAAPKRPAKKKETVKK